MLESKALNLKPYIFILLFPLAFCLGSCSDAEKPAPLQAMAADTALPTATVDTLAIEKPTETFKGTLNDKAVVFSHKDFQSYTLNMGGMVTSGQMNTERGYGDDRDATVYVLNSDKPKKEQQYLVRTPKGSVYMLDQDRFVMDEAIFEPVTAAAAAAIVPAAKPKPAKTESAKKEPAPEKPAVREKAVTKTAAKKPETVKKSSAKKKIGKSAKKKKPARKANKNKKKKGKKKQSHKRVKKETPAANPA